MTFATLLYLFKSLSTVINSKLKTFTPKTFWLQVNLPQSLTVERHLSATHSLMPFLTLEEHNCHTVRNSNIFFNPLPFFHTVTPNGSRPNPPREHQEGDAGFAIMFPSMDGVQIKPFHFCKKSISPTALKEAGLVNLTAV